jgi:hypothetical protein
MTTDRNAQRNNRNKASNYKDPWLEAQCMWNVIAKVGTHFFPGAT